MSIYKRKGENRKREKNKAGYIHMSLIPALSKLKQEDCVVETNLDYSVKACVRNWKDRGTGEKGWREGRGRRTH